MFRLLPFQATHCSRPMSSPIVITLLVIIQLELVCFLSLLFTVVLLPRYPACTSRSQRVLHWLSSPLESSTLVVSCLSVPSTNIDGSHQESHLGDTSPFVHLYDLHPSAFTFDVSLRTLDGHALLFYPSCLFWFSSTNSTHFLTTFLSFPRLP